MLIDRKIPVGGCVVLAGCAVLVGCGGGMQTRVARAPLPVVESCSARVAESVGWRLRVLSRAADAVELAAFVSGTVHTPATSPSGTTGYTTPLRDGRKVIGTRTVLTDRNGDTIRTGAKGLSRLVLKPTGPRETTLETKSYGMTPYREIAEQCAAAPDSTRPAS